MTPVDYEVLRKEPGFRYFVNTLYYIYQVFQRFGNQQSKEEIQNLIDQIEEEIEKLEGFASSHLKNIIILWGKSHPVE